VTEPNGRAATLAKTEILLVLGLCAVVAGAWAVERTLGLDGPVQIGPVVSLVMSVVPGLLWLAYFYMQDRDEPEPKHYVLGVFLLGAFVAAPVAGFFGWHAVPGRGFTPENLVLAVIPCGLAQEFAKYMVVRYSVYLSDEFDEPLDGIIYMTAAGIGFATAENYHYLRGLSGSVFLATGVMNVVVTTLAHGSIAGVLGYALGQARFTAAPGRRAGLLLGALLLASVLNGAFNLLEAMVKVSGMHVEPWRGVAFAAVFAALVFAGTYALMARSRRAVHA
jgi:RsiW-degrading membrane proteinase PrsW (M82 family)